MSGLHPLRQTCGQASCTCSCLSPICRQMATVSEGPHMTSWGHCALCPELILTSFPHFYIQVSTPVWVNLAPENRSSQMKWCTDPTSCIGAASCSLKGCHSPVSRSGPGSQVRT